MIRITIVESPYSGDVEANVAYAKRACDDCFEKNETPYASHLFFPQFLDDSDDDERELGIRAGYDIALAVFKAMKTDADDQPNVCLTIAFYVDNGWSQGMEAAVEFYSQAGIPIEIRRLDAKPAQ